MGQRQCRMEIVHDEQPVPIDRPPLYDNDTCARQLAPYTADCLINTLLANPLCLRSIHTPHSQPTLNPLPVRLQHQRA